MFLSPVLNRTKIKGQSFSLLSFDWHSVKQDLLSLSKEVSKERKGSGIMNIGVNETYFPADLCLVDFEACGNATPENLQDLCSFVTWVLNQKMSLKFIRKTYRRDNRNTDNHVSWQEIRFRVDETLSNGLKEYP